MGVQERFDCWQLQGRQEGGAAVDAQVRGMGKRALPVIQHGRELLPLPLLFIAGTRPPAYLPRPPTRSRWC